MDEELFAKPFASKNLLSYLWRHRRPLRPYLLWRILSVLVTIPFPVITQRIVDQSIPAMDYTSLWVYTLYAAVLLSIFAITMRMAVISVSKTVQVMMRNMRARIFQKLQFMHFGFLDKTQTGRLLSKYAFDTQNMEGALLPILNNVIPETVRAIALTLVLSWLDPWLMVFVTVRSCFCDRPGDLFSPCP